MAVDIFMDIDGVKGESQDKKHTKTIDVLAWSWGMSQSGTTHMGSGGGSGKVAVHDLSFTKYVDSSTPQLMLFCSNGKHLKEAKLFIRRAAGEKEGGLEYLKITMNEIIISSLSTGGSGGEDRFTENVTLNFAKVKVEYTPQKEDGTADAVKNYIGEIATNAYSA
jgi:type VI secretion system secreted protein Hcp